MKISSVFLLASASGALSASIYDYPGYTATNVVETSSRLTADLTLAGEACNIYGTDIKDLKLLVEYQTDSRLHVKIYDADLQVYQVSESVLPRPPSQNVDKPDSKLSFTLTADPFSFFVARTDPDEILFNTNGTQLIFESQYVNIRTSLPDDPNLYGLGEHSDSFRLSTDNYKRTLWNAESPFIPENSNLYGSHPNYLEHRGEAGSHGVALLSSNGMDININKTDSGEQYLEYNILGGVIDLYFLAGPTPTDVSKQYADVVGLPAMMSYWTFGFQQCKYGWPDIETEAAVVANYSAANIPLEAMWADIDYMDKRQDFTTDPELYPLDKMRDLVGELHKNGQKYVMMLDPGIHYRDDYVPYTRGKAANVFIKAADESLYRGEQWAGEVVWPDWFAPGTQDWWTDEIKRFFDPETGLDIDGAWNDMNEVSNFCADTNCDPSEDSDRSSKRSLASVPQTQYTKRDTTAGDMKGLPDRDLFSPKYRIDNHQGDISIRTLYTNNTNSDGSVQYDTHNLHGLMMITATRAALLTRRPQSRPFVLTRSTFAGAGSKAAHWFGDNESSWAHYRATITQMLSFAAVHAMPMVGSDVCGFNGKAEEKMCARWTLLGAFQPFYRNHADISAPNQELYLWDLTTQAARKAIDARYRLLDYIYTAMYRASQTGAPLVNPLFFLYPNDKETFGIDLQWFYGDALLVSPVTEENATSVTFYLPDDVFYDFWTYEKVEGKGATITMNNISYTDIPVHIRGGTILPMRSASGNTTAQVRENNFTLVVAPGRDGKASGTLYVDDGDSLDVGDKFSDIMFEWDGDELTATSGSSFGYEVVVDGATVLTADGPIEYKGPGVVKEGFKIGKS
ncbi:glycosyl hydrolases family 31-domain-containing protein [Astrocystis sublimbata]|nr:glycosyl hydrolases family 31-domain-containing protein [Astrocystis sublimbata]